MSQEAELILGNSHVRFSGVTSTMLQVLPYQQKLMNLVVLGKHNLPDPSIAVSFKELLKICQAPLADGKARIFHARRNDEMIQAILLRKLAHSPVKIVFTSTAQRHHTGFTRWLMAQMDSVITTCEAAASYLKKSPDTIIPHGVDLQQYRPLLIDESPAAKLENFGKYRIGIFGRVRQQKGVDIFVEALLPLLPNYPEFSAVVVGEITPDSQKFVNHLQAKIDAAGLTNRVQFLGKQPFNHIPALFRSMSLVAALSRNEGFGLTVLEAMASGVPVVASEAGAWAEVVRHGIDGFVVPVGNIDSARDRFIELMESPERLTKMGKNARERILQNYSVEREAGDLCKHFCGLQ